MSTLKDELTEFIYMRRTDQITIPEEVGLILREIAQRLPKEKDIEQITLGGKLKAIGFNQCLKEVKEVLK